MLLTDFTYFDNDIFIPNLKECLHDYSYLVLFTDWERECLRMVLGECLFQEMLLQLEFNPESNLYKLKDGVDDKWNKLLFGHTYTKEESNVENNHYSFRDCDCGCPNGCDKYHWKGIWDIHTFQTNINGNTETIVRNKSLVAYYIYWKWSLDTSTITTGTGEKLTDVKNTIPTSNKRKRVNAYNNFVSWVTHCSKGGRVSLNHYLTHWQNEFPEWSKVCLKPTTTWY